jgi:hypothetical protein
MDADPREGRGEEEPGEEAEETPERPVEAPWGGEPIEEEPDEEEASP